MSYTPSAHDALCICEPTQPSTQATCVAVIPPGSCGQGMTHAESFAQVFTQEEVDQWN